MVLLASRLSSQVFEIFNEKLEPVGEIVRPVSAKLLGSGEGTVYLVRPMPRLEA